MADDFRRDDAATEWLGEPADVRHIVSRIAAMARQGVPGVDYASICVRHPSGRLETLTATEPLLYQADGMQYDLNEGPGYDAVTDQDVVYSSDLANDARWPSFGPQAGALGLLSLLAIRLVHPGRLYMALNLYSNTRGAFEHHRDIVVHAFSSHAKDAFGLPQEVDTLRESVDASLALDRATGLLMQRDGLDAVHALELLARLASEPDHQLDAARRIVAEAATRAPRTR